MGVKVECDLVSDFYQQGKVRKFTVECDEPEEIAGTDRAPRPVEYLLLGLGFCQTSICLEIASTMGLHLSRISATAHANLDLRGIYGTAEVSPQFRDTRIDIALETEQGGQEHLIPELIRLMKERCPAYATFVNPVSVTTRVYVNGQELEQKT